MRYFLGLIVFFGAISCGSTTGRTRYFVAESDGIIRPPRSEYDIAYLLKSPSTPHRVIARLVAYRNAMPLRPVSDAQKLHPEQTLFNSLLELAGNLGAHAVVQISRRLDECVTNAELLSDDIEAIGAFALSKKPDRQECIEIVADAVVFAGEYSCEASQECMTRRDDAFDLDPDEGLLKPTLYDPSTRQDASGPDAIEGGKSADPTQNQVNSVSSEP
ncbi:MAG: hypothetical protein AAF219_08275 [Myxococcota bacterium]